ERADGPAGGEEEGGEHGQGGEHPPTGRLPVQREAPQGGDLEEPTQQQGEEDHPALDDAGQPDDEVARGAVVGGGLFAVLGFVVGLAAHERSSIGLRYARYGAATTGFYLPPSLL